MKFDSNELKRLREFLGWTIPSFVKRLESIGLTVSERTIVNWERGDTAPGADDLGKIASLTGVDIKRFYKD